MYRSKQRGPRTDCSYRSSLIWVHTVCHRRFFNISADENSRWILLQVKYPHYQQSHGKPDKVACAPNKDSHQPEYLPSLICLPCLPEECYYPYATQQRLIKLDRIGRLISHRWTHTLISCMFCRDSAQLCYLGEKYKTFFNHAQL